MFGRAVDAGGAPFGICPEEPAALMVTDGFRECSCPEPEGPVGGAPLATGGAAMVEAGCGLFTKSAFAFWGVPAITGAAEVEWRVAWAYERGCCEPEAAGESTELDWDAAGC